MVFLIPIQPYPPTQETRIFSGADPVLDPRGSEIKYILHVPALAESHGRTRHINR